MSYEGYGHPDGHLFAEDSEEFTVERKMWCQRFSASSSRRSNGKPSTMSHPRFSWEINLGHIIQVGAILVAVVVGWFAMERRISAVETRAGMTVEALMETKSNLKALSESQLALVRQLDRLAVIVERK